MKHARDDARALSPGLMACVQAPGAENSTISGSETAHEGKVCRRPGKSTDAAGYSTVTDFARLRGWSTSVPRTTAV